MTTAQTLVDQLYTAFETFCNELENTNDAFDNADLELDSENWPDMYPDELRQLASLMEVADFLMRSLASAADAID